jgi:hypothetical protein
VTCRFWQQIDLFMGLFQIKNKYKCLQYKHRRGNFVVNVQQHYALKIRFFCGATAPSNVGHLIDEVSDHRVLHSIVSRTPLEEGSAHQRPLCNNTHHSQEMDIHAPVGFKHSMPASVGSLTYIWRPRLQNKHRKWTTCCKIWTHYYLLSEFLHAEQLVSCM